MPIPDYQSLMLPLLKLLADGKEHDMAEVMPIISDQFDLTDEERKELLPSGKMTTVRNRMGWARTYLKKAGLLEQPRRAIFCITDKGRKVLAQNPERIDNKFLQQFPEFVEFKSIRNDKEPTATEPGTQTPEESLETAYAQIRAGLEAEILSIILAGTPEFFERLVIDVLVGMGYGGNRRDAGQAVGKNNDGGIDGIIKEDKLGLDTIYIQAKKWENSVQRPEIQKFAGALQGVRARKGVFITTSRFSSGAVEYANTIDNKIVLIDGTMLAGLMVEYNVGVSPANVYEVKRLDMDYFEED